MDSSLSLIRALATTLLTEIDSLATDDIATVEDGSFNLYEKVREFEVKLIKAALLKTSGNQRRAAMLLGIRGTTLHNKIKTYKIKYSKLSLDEKNTRSQFPLLG